VGSEAELDFEKSGAGAIDLDESYFGCNGAYYDAMT
jgi:hypothetical protein